MGAKCARELLGHKRNVIQFDLRRASLALAPLRAASVVLGKGVSKPARKIPVFVSWLARGQEVSRHALPGIALSVNSN